MAITEIEIKDWPHLMGTFGEFDNRVLLGLARCFRGQSNREWPLRDSLSRLIPSATSLDESIAIEREATRLFGQTARLRAESSMIPKDDELIDWWALMQHFGAPTRLLDWTLSPFVALYFAVASNWNVGGAVWSVAQAERCDDQYDYLKQYLRISNKQSLVFWDVPPVPDFCFFIEPGRHNLRMASQLGLFSVCGQIPNDHGLKLSTTLGSMREVTKYIIPAELKPDFLMRLRTMNLAPHSLFPGLDGLGGTIRDAVTLEFHRKARASNTTPLDFSAV